MSKIFFSRRFWIPFLVCAILFAVYFGAGMWRLYREDFTSRDIEGRVRAQWLYASVSGGMGEWILLNGLFAGHATYMHYVFRKGNYIRLLSLELAGMLGLMTVLIFYFNSFIKPLDSRNNLEILSSVVFTQPGEPYKREPVLFRSYKMLPLPALTRYTDSLDKQVAKITRSTGIDLKLMQGRYELFRMWLMPLMVITWFLAAYLTGYLARRLPVFITWLSGFFLFFTPWIYLHYFFRRLYFQHSTGLWMGAGGETFIMLALLALLYRLFWKRPEYRLAEPAGE